VIKENINIVRIIFLYNKSKLFVKVIKMKTLIIYDSYFGNTEKIAKEIFDAILEKKDTVITKVDKMDKADIESFDLLIVGSPTRAFKMTKNISGFLKSLDEEKLRNKKIALFDTRMNVEKADSKFLKFMAKHFGYAVDSMAKKIEKRAKNSILEEKWFYVKDSEGPLLETELENAREWVERILKKF
jgi:flavodoxin